MTTEERLARLERENHGWRLATLALGASLLVILLGSCGRETVVPPATTAAVTAKEKAGADDPSALESAISKVHDVIRAHRFELLDSNGKLVAVLGMDNNSGKRGLDVFDENGKPRAMLGVEKVGSNLALTDEKGNERVMLAVLESGPSLGLLDEKPQVRAVLKVSKDGPMLDMLDKNDKPRAMLAVVETGPGPGPQLALTDEEGEGRAMLGVNKKYGANLVLLDENGQPLRH